MWDMGPERKVSAMLMLGGLGLAAGAAGLPFAQDAGKAVEATFKLITNADPNFEEHFLQFMKEDPLGLGANAGKTFLHGVEPFGIDLGGLSFGVSSRAMRSRRSIWRAPRRASSWVRRNGRCNGDRAGNPMQRTSPS